MEADRRRGVPGGRVRRAGRRGGDHFALIRLPERPDVFAWDHEPDSRYRVANDLRDHLGRSPRTAGDGWYRRD